MLITRARITRAVLVAFAAACAASNVCARQQQRAGEVAFRGTLGAPGKVAIQMRLRREGEKLTGSYFYESVGKDLTLRGTIDATGGFQLQEFDAAGAQTGLFKGRWKGPECDDCVETLAGRWTRPDGTRALDFVLAEFPAYFTSGTRLIPKSLKESRRRGKWGGYEVAAEYPQLQGAGANTQKFNEEVRALVLKEVGDFKKLIGDDPAQGGESDWSFYVSYADDSLVSVDISDYFYYFGAGSRNAVSETFNYDLARGRALKLADIFEPSSDYLKVISDACNRELKRRFAGESFPDAGRIAASVEGVVGDEKKWLISKEGVVIVFDSTEFGPSGSGENTVVVPFAELKKVIRADGPLARLAK